MDASACVRCPYHWCDLTLWTWLYIQVRSEGAGFDLGSPRPFSVAPVDGDGAGEGALENVHISKEWWQKRQDVFVLSFDPGLSAHGLGGL